MFISFKNIQEMVLITSLFLALYVLGNVGLIIWPRRAYTALPQKLRQYLTDVYRCQKPTKSVKFRFKH